MMKHSTTVPKQNRTDTFAVFGDQSAQLDPNDDLTLIGRVEVPRYDQPDADGQELDREERLAVAVARAIERLDRPEPPVGERFQVMTDLSEPLERVAYDPTSTTGVWNPEDHA